METIIKRLENIIKEYSPQLQSIDEQEFSRKPSAKKWSKKEILGHLIDSAQNNVRRFIVSQYEEQPFIIYDQDKWVAMSKYQEYSSKDLIDFWRLMNKHICVVLSGISPEAAIRKCETNDSQVHTVEWLAEDYIRHLLHHLHQILPLEPVAYP